MAKKSLVVSRKASSGPRTLEGKERSKLNAVKHGIFAAVVLTSESYEEYQELLADLCEAYQPVGRLEDVLVEKLAATVWRQRRLLMAESAEIEKARTDHEPGLGTKISSIELANALWADRGSIAKAFLSHDEGHLALDAKTLEELRDKIRQDGLDWERDRNVLLELYGGSAEESGPVDAEGKSDHDPSAKTKGVRESAWVTEYRVLAQKSTSADRRGKRQAANQMIDKLNKQIEFLKDEFMKADYRKREMKELLTTAALVPGEKASERLLRYEASLERVFDRTLTQLERLQRMRLGQPILPPVKIDVAS